MSNNLGLFGDGQNKSTLFNDTNGTSVFNDEQIVYQEPQPLITVPVKRGRPILYKKKKRAKVHPKKRRARYVNEKRSLNQIYVDDAEFIARKMLGTLNVKYEGEYGRGSQKVKTLLFEWLCSISKT